MIRGLKNTFPILLLIAIFGWACTEDDKDASGPLPVAHFTASATEISAGDTVYFTDQSENDPYLWTWLFQGGEPSSSNQPNPVVVFPGSGNYRVELTVRNDHGADYVSKDNYMVVTAPPVIDVDIPAQIRLEFEGNLNSTGEIDLVAETAGVAEYTVRPGGGDAFAFNGSNALTLSGYNGINGDGPRTVAMWVRTSTNGMLTSWGAAGTFSRATFVIQPNGFIRLAYDGGGVNAITDITDGVWHHVAYTYDGSNIILYVNGAEESSRTGLTLRTGEAGETEVAIGSREDGSGQWVGDIDDFRIFDVALSPEDIKILSEME